MNYDFRFSAGPWNVHEGADPFGPPVRDTLDFARKLEIFKGLGFDYVQFHDDDVVPDGVDHQELERIAGEMRKVLDGEGMQAEFVAPRLWEDPRTVDGPITSNCPEERTYALERGKRTVDIANILGTDRIVLWPAREGTYIRESKDAVASIQRIVDFCDALLEYDSSIRILGEMKPNEPMDLMYLATPGHFLSICYRTCDPDRTGVLIESAHAILAGLDPSDEMALAIWHGKLWGVHLNDQNGLKFDQDKSFGSVNLRRAFNQVDLLVRHDYGTHGEVVGFDVKAMRTQPAEIAHLHLQNSRDVFLQLVEVARTIDRDAMAQLVKERNYEALDLLVLQTLMGVR